MANPEHLAMLKQGVAEWNKWRKGNPEVTPDLSGAQLVKAKLSGVDFATANLRSATLSEADLTGGVKIYGADLCNGKLDRATLIGANLMSAKLIGTNFHGATLSWANFSGCDLTTADMTEANLHLTNFRGATVRGLKLTSSLVRHTVFADLDLSLALDLQTVQHLGPSTIGIDTIYKSKSKIPEVFLRGCGVPEEFIAYIGSMVGRPIEYYSCFISYSTKDQTFADRLYADLQAKGVRCWFAPHDIKGGRKIHEQIDEAIRMHDKLLLILSENSMASEWVKIELGKALKHQKQDGKRALFPVRLVSFDTMEKWEYIDSSGKNLAEEIRQYFIPDFSQWAQDHGAYQKALGKLVEDLTAGG